MNTLKTLLIIFALGFFTQLSAQEFALNTSKLYWTGKAAFSSYKLSGTLETSNGYAIVKNDTLTSLKIEVNMKKLEHENEDLKSHLRGPDFFEVNHYETANFELLNAVPLNSKSITLIGNLTIKDITKKEEIKVQVNKDTLTLEFEISLDRTDYGVSYNSPSIFKKLKENAIEDTFELKGTLQFK